MEVFLIFLHENDRDMRKSKELSSKDLLAEGSEQTPLEIGRLEGSLSWRMNKDLWIMEAFEYMQMTSCSSGLEEEEEEEEGGRVSSFLRLSAPWSSFLRAQERSCAHRISPVLAGSLLCSPGV